MLPYFQRSKKINKIGVMVRDLRPSTTNYSIIELGNKIANECSDIDFYVFNEEWYKPHQSICFPLLQQRHICGFDGKLIATNIETAKKLINIPNTCQKFFYVWNLIEWTNSLTKHKDVLELYTQIPLITRSELYAEILEKNFNLDYKVHIIKDFNYEQSVQLFKS